MPFTVPQFPLGVNVWHAPATPPGLPSLVTVGNLAWGKRVSSSQGLYVGETEPLMTLLLPVGTDVRSVLCGVASDVIEVPSGSGRYYTVIGVDDIGKGFPNEHRAAVLVGTGAFGSWPIPIP